MAIPERNAVLEGRRVRDARHSSTNYCSLRKKKEKCKLGLVMKIEIEEDETKIAVTEVGLIL